MYRRLMERNKLLFFTVLLLPEIFITLKLSRKIIPLLLLLIFFFPNAEKALHDHHESACTHQYGNQYSQIKENCLICDFEYVAHSCEFPGSIQVFCGSAEKNLFSFCQAPFIETVSFTFLLRAPPLHVKSKA
jgi:hypothetical protein